MPPRAREPKAEDEKPAARSAKKDGEICRQDWPAGWPEGATSAVCDHGQWSRQLPPVE